ncbi:uncharacterized protein LOC134251497 [Saccostrea cucullata]|uniref:uncharacterized protein LOC134251497 n=1 Tax=Saccostrea cuccullata TaxID=36930 RepID=UPI002ED1FAF9
MIVMSLNWTLSLLISCVVFNSAYFQCTERGCVCHCTCCRACLFTPNCGDCYREWSGTLLNRCQRKNIAYGVDTASQTTTLVKGYEASKAVDEDEETFSSTQAGYNVTFSLEFSDVKRLKYIYIYYYERGEILSFYE